METKTIAKVNNVAIIAGNDPEKLVPIKPICEAIGVNSEGQRQRIERDEILASVACMIKATAPDGKQYEMYAIPFKFTFGWLFGIDINRVDSSAKDTVLKYKIECYNALFEYFIEPQTFLKQKQVAMEEKVNEYQECQRKFKDAQKLMNNAKAELNDVMRITIDDWRANNRQLVFQFDNGSDS